MVIGGSNGSEKEFIAIFVPIMPIIVQGEKLQIFYQLDFFNCFAEKMLMSLVKFYYYTKLPVLL
jgi:hypothetical protein